MYNLFSRHSSKVGKCRITVLTLQSKLPLESRALSIPHLSFWSCYYVAQKGMKVPAAKKKQIMTGKVNVKEAIRLKYKIITNGNNIGFQGMQT